MSAGLPIPTRVFAHGWITERRRDEDRQVARQRDGSVRDDAKSSAPTRCAISSCARRRSAATSRSRSRSCASGTTAISATTWATCCADRSRCCRNTATAWSRSRSTAGSPSASRTCPRWCTTTSWPALSRSARRDLESRHAAQPRDRRAEAVGALQARARRRARRAAVRSVRRPALAERAAVSVHAGQGDARCGASSGSTGRRRCRWREELVWGRSPPARRPSRARAVPAHRRARRYRREEVSPWRDRIRAARPADRSQRRRASHGDRPCAASSPSRSASSRCISASTRRCWSARSSRSPSSTASRASSSRCGRPRATRRG